MALTYGKSSYSSLIDDILADINEEDKLAHLSDEQLQVWILEAEKQICDRVQVKDQYTLGLNSNVTKYYFQDRPVVTAATTATPIVLTAASHGLSATNRINLIGVNGLSGANGNRYVSAADTNTITIKECADITNATNATPISITTQEAHGWSTGALITITGVLGNTAANVTDNAITVVDSKTFTLDGVAGNGSYTSGGIAVKNTVGSGTYTSGGRFWKDDELPTYFKKFIRGDRTWGVIKREIRVCDMMELRNKDREISELYGVWDDYDSPMLLAEWNDDFQRYIEIYPYPRSDHNATLYGTIKVTPKDYVGESLTNTIILHQDYDECIKRYVKYKVYKVILKDNPNCLAEYQFYEQELKTMDRASGLPMRQRISYR